MHAFSVNDSSCKLWAYTSVWYKNAPLERKRSKSISVIFTLTSAEALEPDFRINQRLFDMSGHDCAEPSVSVALRIFFVFLTRRGWQHRRRGSKRFPRWVIFIAFTHLSTSVYWFFHAPVSLCFHEKCLKKKRKKEMSSASWHSAEMFVIYRWRLRSGSELTSGLGDRHQALWSRFPRRNVWGFLAYKNGPKYITLASTSEQGGMYLWHTHKYNHTHTLL